MIQPERRNTFPFQSVFFAVYKREKKDAEPSMGASSAVLCTAETHIGGRKGEILPLFGLRFFRRLSSFDGACHDSLDNVLLAGKIEDDDRDDRQDDQCHNRAEVNLPVAAVEILDVDRDGAVLLDVQHKVGQQIVVPDPNGLEDADRDKRGLHDRQNDAEEST